MGTLTTEMLECEDYIIYLTPFTMLPLNLYHLLSQLHSCSKNFYAKYRFILTKNIVVTVKDDVQRMPEGH